MSETITLDGNKILRVTDAETLQSFKASGEKDRDKTDYLEITANSGASGSTVIKIEAKNDNETDVDIELNPKGAGTCTIGGTGLVTAEVGGITLNTGDFTATAGDFISTAGDLLLTLGNATLTAGDLTLTLGDFTMDNGNALLTSGNLTLTAGNIVNTLGDVTLTQGDLTVTSGGIVHTAGTVTSANAKAGGTVSGTGVTAVTNGLGPVFKTVFTLSSTPIVLVDETDVTAYGGLKIFEFPEGLIMIQGAVTNLTTALSAAGVDADWNGDIGLGTVTADNDATPLATTEQDIIPNTATPQAVDSVGTAHAVSTTSENVPFDGTGGAISVFINMLVDDADHDVTGTPTNIELSGTISLTWTLIGDHA